jgi:threonine/homoserine/homoserine lactone efflux protein
MDTSTFLLFSATVIPLVCTPGPDILFIASQAVTGGSAAASIRCWWRSGWLR